MQRSYFRRADQIRPMSLAADINSHAEASVLFEQGKTKVVCTVTLSCQVPLFLRGKKKWWLTASYALLPASTSVRTEREAIGKRQDRSIEISRLIGRSLRSIIDLNDKQDERTIYIDCDVIQADGGTRTACINGAFAALMIAQQRWLSKQIITKPIITHDMAAISVGLKEQYVLLDIDFNEDSTVTADFNFVMTRSGDIIEVQGCGEKSPIQWTKVEEMKQVAHKGIQQILSFFDGELFKKSPKVKESVAQVSTV